MAGIAIVDYGMANLRSVQKAFERVGAAAEITSDPHVVARADKVVLPGVGAFRDAIAQLPRDRACRADPRAHRTRPAVPGHLPRSANALRPVATRTACTPGSDVLPGDVVRFPHACRG